MDERRAPYWLVPIVVLAAWWPLAPYWQSDDFIALHHVSDLDRALSDFFGPLYGVESLAVFYRPLITMSFWLDSAIGGSEPFAAHLSNSLAHTLSGWLVALIVGRYLGALGGLSAGLIWGLSPAHAGSVLWAAGRVDSHTTVWILLCTWLLQMYCDERLRWRWPAMLAFCAALLSKELAIVLPGVAVLVGFAAPARHEPLGERTRLAAQASWPLFALVPLYLTVRYAALGQLVGGYEAAQLDLGAGVAGLVTNLGRLLNPLLYAGGSVVEVPEWATYLGFLPVLVAIAAILVKRRAIALAGFGAFFLGCALPLAQFWSFEGLKDLRMYYLPFAGLAGLIAAGGVVPSLLALAVFALPFIDMREHYEQQFARSRTIHERLIEADADLDDPTWFVHGLPAENPTGTVLAFHLGVDRLLRPPFADSDKRVFALRPLGGGDALAIPYGDELGLPAGTTVGFDGPGIFGQRRVSRELPDVEVAVRGEVTTAAIAAMTEGTLPRTKLIPTVAATHYRVTIFTAGGYVTTVVAPDDAGHIDAFELLRTGTYTRPDAPVRYVAHALEVPTTMDLDVTFPVMVEAGQGRAPFVATHASRRFVELTFDRGYSDFVPN